MRRFLRRLLGLVAFLIFGFAAWGSYYVCNHGFSRHWRVRVSQEFRRRGLDLYVHRLTLDPVHGFVAREVQIFDANDPSKIMATIDRVDLDINLTNLLHSRPFLDAVDLRNADLSLPINGDDPQSERVKVSHLNARIIMPQHEWYISEAEATMYGVQVLLRGRLQNPEAFQENENNSANHTGSTRPQIALALVRILESLHYGGQPGRVEINLGGDLEDPRTIFADATVWGEKVRRGTGTIGQLYAAISLRSNVIELKQLKVDDAHGELNASASYDSDHGAAHLQLRSTLDPSVAANFFKTEKLLDGWKFDAPPVVEISGTAHYDQKTDSMSGLLTGRAAAEKFSIKSVSFSGAGADFSWDGNRWYVRNGWLANQTGRVAMQAISVPGSFRARIDSGINPVSIYSLLSPPVADAMHDWDFRESPKVSLNITGTSMNPLDWETRGNVSLGRTLMRGVPLDWANSAVDVKGALATYNNFDIQRDEGAAKGSFSYDFDKHEAWLINVHARFNTAEAAVWINPDLPRQLEPYRFKTAPDVTLNGFVQCANDKGTHLDVHVDAPGGMDYTFCKKDLSFPSVNGDILFREHEVMLKNVTGALSGGSVEGGADIKFGSGNPGYTADVTAKEIDFANITKLYFNYSDSHGLLNGAFNFGGKNDDPWTLYGKGQIGVTEGNVFAIPVLGPFSSILNTMVPGMGYNSAHDGTCSFAVENGVITTHDFLVKGMGFSMIGDGRLLFLDDRLNFNIRLNAQGLPGVLLFPVSKLLEYAGTGSLENPVWKPVLLGSAGTISKRQPDIIERPADDASDQDNATPSRFPVRSQLGPRDAEGPTRFPAGPRR